MTFDYRGIGGSLGVPLVRHSGARKQDWGELDLAAALDYAGQAFVAAPVSGRPDMAMTGALFVVAAGKSDAIERVAPLLEAIGQRTFVVPDQPRAANLVKLSGNFLIASVIEALGEAMALADRGGVERMRFLDVMTSTLFGAPVYRTYGSLIAQRKFEPAGFAAPLGQKDIRLVLAAAEALRVPMPGREPAARSFPRPARTGWRALGLVGDRTTCGNRCRGRRPRNTVNRARAARRRRAG